MNFSPVFSFNRDRKIVFTDRHFRLHPWVVLYRQVPNNDYIFILSLNQAEMPRKLTLDLRECLCYHEEAEYPEG